MLLSWRAGHRETEVKEEWAVVDGKTQSGQDLGKERGWAGTTPRSEWRRRRVAVGLTRDQNKVMTTTRCARSVRKREGTSPEIRSIAPRPWSRGRGL